MSTLRCTGAVLLALSLQASVPVAQEVRIALVGPFSGSSRHVGERMYETANRVVETLNASGGMDGLPVVLEIRDDGCDPEQARRVAEELMSSFRPHAVIGHCPEVVESVAPVYDNGQTIYFALTAPGETDPAPGQYVFRLGMRGNRLGESAAHYIATQWSDPLVHGGSAPRIGIVRDGTPFGHMVARGLADQLARENMEVAFDEVVDDPSRLSALAGGQESTILFFATAAPNRVAQLVAGDLQAPAIVLPGVPNTADAVWHDFWRRMEERTGVGDVAVVTPSLLSVDESPYTMFFDLLLERPDPSMEEVYVLAALELLTMAIDQAGSTDPDRIEGYLRGDPLPTVLGPLRSGETGEIKPIPYQLCQVSTGTQWKSSELFRWSLADWGVGEESPPGDSQYNVVVEPEAGIEPLVLVPDQPTTVTFSIGAPLPDSALKHVEPSEILDRIADEAEINLVVTLYADVGAADTFQQQEILYRPQDRSSGQATFTLVPRTEAVGGSGGLGSLIFVVDAHGMEIDVIHLPAFVGEPPASAEVPQSGKLAMEALDRGELSFPDLILSVASEGNGKIPVVVRPLHPDLLALMRARMGEPEGKLWSLRSGLSQTDLDGLVRQAYLDLHALVAQNDDALQRVYRGLGREVEVGPGGAMLRFDDQDRAAMLEALHRIGKRLYWRLFQDGEQRLRQALSVVEEFAATHSKPLKVRVLSAEVYAPWQLLYPPTDGPIDPLLFWGFRHDLGTLQLVSGVQGRAKTVLEIPSSNEVVVASWRKRGPNDSVGERASLLVADLKRKVGGNVQVSQSRSDLEQALRDRAADLKLLLAYGHGSSGTQLVVDESTPNQPQVITVADVNGPCLIFGENDFFTATAIDDLRPTDRPQLFEGQPIVILNACETGTSGTRVADNNGFVGAFTRSGARAIIVTEAPVWANFAYHFGRDFLDVLFRGAEVRSALRRTRLRHLEEWKNPLGLVYSLYGNPAVRIVDPNR